MHDHRKGLLQLLQLLLHLLLPEPWQPRAKPPIRCPQCSGVMEIFAVCVRT